MTRLALAMVFALAGCGDKKPAAEAVDEDYDAAPVSEERKLRGKSNNVSPDSVKRDVEIRQKQHERRTDQALDL